MTKTVAKHPGIPRFKSFVALGSNVGDRRKNMERALAALSRESDIVLKRWSSLYETSAVGGPKQRDFLNAVVEIKTSLPPRHLLQRLLDVEKKLGRVRRKKWGPRIIDLDLLVVDSLIVRSRTLSLPHPRYHQRRFVLIPFAELSPKFIHPLLKRSNARLLRELTPMGQRVTMLGQWNKSPSYRSKRVRKTNNRSSR